MGRANPCLFFVVEDKWVNHPDFEPYKAQGHTFQAWSQWLDGSPLRGHPDAFLLENAFNWTDADFPYFAATVSTVRALHRERVAKVLNPKPGGNA